MHAALRYLPRRARDCRLQNKLKSSKPAAKSSKTVSKTASNAKGGKAKAKGSTPAALRKKFLISGFKFSLYLTSFLLGAYTLSTEWWTFSRKDYFDGYPNHTMTDVHKMYYLIGSGNVLYMFIKIMADNISLLDKTIMLVHHLTTCFLLALSYYFGFARIGAVILTLHDAADPFMEFAKMSLYAGNEKLADIFFALFAIVFIVTRNIIFPFYVILSIRLYAFYPDGSDLPNYSIKYSAEAALWILEILHIYWAALIIHMAIKAIRGGGVEDDVREQDD
eukprot:jgi/Hompol1/4871/HPOL_001853-RA